jgi:hypothetical protein
MTVHEHTKAVLALVEMRYQRFTVVRITKIIPTINEPGERLRVRAAHRLEICALPFHAGLRGFTCSAVIFFIETFRTIGSIDIVSVRRTTARDSTGLEK